MLAEKRVFFLGLNNSAIITRTCCCRNKRTKEELDKARAPQGFAAKGLTYRQAEAPDDLPKMDLNYGGETDDSEFGGSTTIQVLHSTPGIRQLIREQKPYGTEK